MRLLGEWNWWLPRRLAVFLPPVGESLARPSTSEPGAGEVGAS
jgi:hypothetical protein